MKYEVPEIKIVNFEANDVIAASTEQKPGGGTGEAGGEEW